MNEVRGNCRVLEAERDKACADYAKLLESSTAVADNLREDIRQLRSQLAAERAESKLVQTQLAELQKRLNEAEKNGTPTTDLCDKVGDIANYAKHLIAEDRKLPHRKQDKEVKLPKGAISKLEAILGGGDG